MSTDKDAKPKATGNDKELDDLLDSALEDFDKVKDKTDTTTNADTLPEVPSAGEPQDELWNEEFLAQAKYFEDQMASLFGNAGAGDAPTAEQFNLGFQKMAEAAQLACQGQGFEAAGSDPQYVDSITKAIKELKEGSENLTAPQAPADMANLFSGLQLNDAAAGPEGNPFLPFVQGMMQSLLSAEVLLPSLRELLEKYPVWLAENGDKIDAVDRERYIKQQELFKIICADLEKERPDDAADVKSERFKKVLENMQKLHEYGQPPVELVGEGPGMGNMGMPPLSAMNDPSQCSVM